MVKGMIEAYFEENSLVKQHLDSFNKFVESGMQDVITKVGKLSTNVEGFEIKLGKVRIEPPRFYEVRGGYRTILPSECRFRNITYASPVFLEMTPLFNGIERPVYSDVFIGEIPVMIKSKLCHLSKMSREELVEAGEDAEDPGGYFIINGSERVLVSVEDLVPNKILTTKEGEKEVVAKVFSTRHGFRARCVVSRNKEGKWVIDFPASAPGITLLTVLQVLGADIKGIKKLFTKDLIVQNDVMLNIEYEKAIDYEDPVDYLSRRLSPGQPEEYRLNRMWNLIDSYLLPHLGTEKADRERKIVYLVRMAERTTYVHHRRLMPDDKDHYGNKRVKLAGDLMEELFRYAFQFLTKDIIYQASRADARGRRLQVHTLVRQDALSDRIRYAMATGNWIAGQTGVSQLLDRTSYVASLSHRRRVISPLSRRHPHFKARDLHGTYYGKICPSETPEGPSCSLVKNLAVFAEVSVGTDETHVEELLKSFGVSEK